MSANRFAALSEFSTNNIESVQVQVKPKKPSRKYATQTQTQTQTQTPITVPVKTYPKAPAEDKNFTAVKSPRKKKNNNTPNKKTVKIPDAVLAQRELRKKYNYAYRVVNNGNVENNTTIYVTTLVAHPHQVEAQFKDAIARAKNMPEIFGENFECDFQVNVVRRYTGEYMGYAFVDVTNPKFYFAMIGCNVDGSDRAEFIDDPNWVPPKAVPKAPRDHTKSFSWADECEEPDENERQLLPPKIRRELPPLITLGEYEYDEQQRLHLQTDATHGSLSVSPAFITPGVKEEYDDCSLYVSEVPAIDYNFLYALFARYARSNSARENDRHHFPRINIRKCIKEGEEKNDNKTGIFAIVEYAHPYDSAFCLCMNQKIRARYNDKDISMPVRYAFRNRR